MDADSELGNAYMGVVGANVTFFCPPGLVLTGPNTTTCMENGEWEPDPRETACTRGMFIIVVNILTRGHAYHIHV